PPLALQRHQVFASADVHVADEDLRNGRSASGALDHQLLHLAAEVDRDLLILDALGLEQQFRPPTIGTEGLGVDLDNRHAGAPLPRYLGKRLNASTAMGAPRAPK